MATQYPLPVTAAQMGSYFVQQYYKLLEQQPGLVQLFYSDVSTMVRIDGNPPETASGLVQIHSLIMSLNFIGVEVTTAHSLESWNGGILVLVAGFVQIRNMSAKRKFSQTLFLAPQEDGFFVLNDIFHLNDAEPVHHQHPAVFLPQSNLDANLNAANIISKPVTNYLMIGEIETMANLRKNSEAENFNSPEQLLQPIPHIEDILKEDTVEESNAVHQNTVNSVQASPPAQVDEPVREPQKHTYASILRVSKGQPAPSTAPQPSPNQKMSPVLERHCKPQGPQSNGQHSSSRAERSAVEISEDVSTIEDEGELKSVYIKNLLPNVSPSEIEEQFKRFGKIKPDGVVIRSRKDLGVCYAFVEFEDTTGVQNAIKVSSVEIAGRPVYIEERRANNNNPLRGGRRGRGSYMTHAPRGRFGARNYGCGSGQNGNDRDYRLRATSETCLDRNDREYRSRTTNGTDQDGSDRDYKPRATNGFYRQVPHQNRGFTGNYVSRNEQNQVASTA